MPTSAAGSKQRGFTPVRRFAEHGFTPVRRFAETGFTPVRRFAEHGFTLVELMVVITIIGLASAVAVLAIPDPGGRVLDEGLRFAARARAARDVAIVEARPVSIWVTSAGYGFDRRLAGAWVPLADKPLRVERWSEGTRAQLAEPRARVTFDPTGVADRGLDIRLERGDAAALVQLGADGEVRADAQ
jgi:general secretion pathway protein H